MNIVFMGTPEFAVPSLSILLENGYAVPAVVTVPDKPRGRGLGIASSAVKEFALQYSLPVLQPESLRDRAFIDELRRIGPDCIVVVAFRILPPEVFSIPRLGSFNLHASLLPRYRGAAPINWAVINGEEETGVTSFFLNEKVDTGSIILQSRLRIGADETAGELHDRLMVIGAQTVLDTVRMIEQGTAVPAKQDDSAASPAPKIFREQCAIDWTKPVRQVHNFIRGLSPLPGAFTHHDGKLLKIFRTRIIDENETGNPGRVECGNGVMKVRTSRGVLEVLELQQEGRRHMPAAEFLQGYRFDSGALLQ